MAGFQPPGDNAGGFDFSDVTRATIYFKNDHDSAAFATWAMEHGLAFFPVVKIQADICREELLFEIELDALVVR